MGIIIVNVFFKDRLGCKLPGTVKRDELANQYLEISDNGKCYMDYLSLSKKEIALMLKTGKIEYENSDVRATPYPFYLIRCKRDNIEYKIKCYDNDSITMVDKFIDIKCSCN